MTNPHGWQPGGWQGQQPYPGQHANPGQAAGQLPVPPPPPGQVAGPGAPGAGGQEGPFPAFSVRELAWVVFGIALITGLVLLGKYGYEAVDNMLEKSWGEGGFAAAAAVGGFFLALGAILFRRRSRAGRVLIILGAIFSLGALDFEDAAAYGLVGAAVIAAILAVAGKSWLRPKVPRWGPGFPGGYGYPQPGPPVPGAPYGQQQHMPGGQQPFGPPPGGYR